MFLIRRVEGGGGARVFDYQLLSVINRREKIVAKCLGKQKKYFELFLVERSTESKFI